MLQFSANGVHDNILAFYFTRIEYCVCLIVITVFNAVLGPHLKPKNNSSNIFLLHRILQLCYHTYL